MKGSLLSLIVAVLAVVPLPARALTELSKMFVFSDSLLDSGNAGILTNGAFPPPTPGYAEGRASNGPVAVEYLWNLFNPGNPGWFQPSTMGGTNFALVGATSGVGNNINIFNSYPAIGPLGTFWQLQTYQNLGSGFNPDTSLFVVWLFSNDALAWINPASPLYLQTPGTFDGQPPQPAPDTDVLVNSGIANIRGTIEQLASDGAIHFLVPNIPDLGSTPSGSSSPASELLTELSNAFNQALEFTLKDLSAGYPDIRIIDFQSDDLFAELTADPDAFGFENASSACLQPDLVMNPSCKPDEWFFWDGNHPTTAGHQFLGQAFFRAVHTPAVPGPLPLFGAWAAFGWSRRLRRILNRRVD